MNRDSLKPHNASAEALGLTLYLDIDSKKELVKDFFFNGPAIAEFREEMEELRDLVVGKKLDDVSHLDRRQLQKETRLKNGRPRVAPMGLWLLKKSLSTFSGEARTLREQEDLLCLCFAVGKREIVESLLSDKDFDLKTLIQTTKATSACGKCRQAIAGLIEKTRDERGLIKGLGHSRSRYDREGQWLKVAGLYPGPLLIKLEELKNEWMKRENIQGQYQLEWMDIEGFHLDVKVSAEEERVREGLLAALSDYLRSQLGVLLFLKSV